MKLLQGTLFFGMTVATTAGAQSLGISPGRDRPLWLDEWSPLSIQGDMPRNLPSALGDVPRLLLQSPKSGLFWSAGNPAGLAWVPEEKYGALSGSYGDETGALKRPLDPGELAASTLEGYGWQPVPAGTVVGRTTFERSDRNRGTFSLVNSPYSSSPFSAADTSHVPLQESRAILEGAGGWRVGDWALGASGGYETRITRSTRSTYLRRNRAVFPSGTIGLARRFHDGAIALGIRGGMRRVSETYGVTEVAGSQGLVYKFQGYSDVAAIDVPGAFNNRARTNATSGGANIAAKIRSVNLVFFADAARLTQKVGSATGNNPPSDVWRTTGITAGSTAQFGFARRHALATIDVRYNHLTGEGDPLGATNNGVGSHESLVLASADIRLNPTGGWIAALSGQGGFGRRSFVDSVSVTSSDIDASSPRVSFELGRSINKSFFLAMEAGLAWYSGNGTFPSSTGRGTVFRTIVAPELDLETSILASRGFGASASWRYRRDAAMWLAAKTELLTGSGMTEISFAGAERRSSRVTLGATLGLR